MVYAPDVLYEVNGMLTWLYAGDTELGLVKDVELALYPSGISKDYLVVVKQFYFENCL